jgi:hypothetical protein
MLYATATTTLNKLNIGLLDTVLTSTGTAPQWSAGLTIAKGLVTTASSISSASTTQATVFDTNAKAVSIGSAATSVSIGSNTASETFTTNVKSYTTSGSAIVTVTANVGLTATISTVARNGSNVATITTTANHGLTNSDTVTIVCTSDTGFNTVNASVTVTGLTTFTYTNTGALVTTVAGSGSVFIGAIGMSLGTTAASSETWLAFGSSPVSAGVRAGMLVQGSANIPAGTVVSGVDATRVYLSAALTGTITSTGPIAFTDTNTSMGIKTGDQITVASSGVANIDGTWPVTTAGSTSTTFSFKVSTATTQTNLARAGTVVKESTFLIRNRNVTIGSSEASASPVAAVIKGENAVGTNIAGANITIQGGTNTGNNTVGGNIVFRTPSQGSTGDVTQSMTERMRIEMSGVSTQLDLTTGMTTVNMFSSFATTVNFANSATTLTLATIGTGARTVNIATAATAGASTLTFGGAVTGNIIKLAGTAAGTVNLTSDVTTGIVNAYTGVTTGTINIGSTQSTVNLGTTVINSQAYISSAETTGVTDATAVVVSSFATATYRTAKFMLQVTCTAGTDINKVQVSEVLFLHDGTIATLTDYAVLRSGNNLVTFTADINGVNARLLAQATTGNTIKVRVVRTLNTI